ncbi:MAG: outer membrane protein assembly factor BamA [Candidatus Omnitrophota bacterium]|nr:outer membrane protein assembly factor BamA [Candidatus Omnitrophota bacterium]MDZ4242419.1 outer membrane protein assembly factor BamA [Candidatus Omnitrophota bacterium]
MEPPEKAPAAAPAVPKAPDAQEPPPAVSPEKKKVVKSIEIKGNKSISLPTILAKIKTRAGQEYLQSVISDDIKRLYNTGFFSDVRVDREDFEGGFKVLFYVTEKSIVDKITFSKLRYFNPKGIVKKLKSKKGKFLDNKELNDDVRTIEDMYTKKGLTSVSVTVETERDELNNKTAIHFVIKEGVRIKVKRIRIKGNTAFKDKRIMKVIKTRPDSLFTSGYLKKDILAEDMDRIKAFYEREGFIDATVSHELEEMTPSRLIVRINIEEGKRYYVEKITLSGNKVADDDEVIAVMNEVKVGGIFSRDKLTVDLSSIRTLYFDKGYIFANVRESTSLNPDTGKVEVKLDVEEGNLAYVNRIKIQGNDRTRDIVIRREMRLYPGDQFDGEKLRRSKQRLQNLGYFEDISYDIEDTDSPSKKDLVVQVKEAKTGTFSFGGGYSTIDQLVGFVEVEQKNFDFTNFPTFTGGGQNLLLRAESGSTRNNMRLSFTEPWLFDYPISGGFDAYRSERSRERDVGYAYDEKRTGGDIRFGKQFTEYFSGSVMYGRENVTIDNFEANVSADLLAEQGKNTISRVSFNLSRDSRDSVFNPTKGLYLSGTADVAGGPFGGDKDFMRFTPRASYNIPFKFDSVLEFRVLAGFADAYGDNSKVPIFERYFAGGARTIRGYNERKVGPLDPVTEDPLGGESMLVGNIEYTIPIIDFLKLATFFDTGNVWSKVDDFGTGDFKSGFGLGLRVKTPIGPINLDYGYPLSDEPGEEDKSGKFYFSVSRGF